MAELLPTFDQSRAGRPISTGNTDQDPRDQIDEHQPGEKERTVQLGRSGAVDRGEQERAEADLGDHAGIEMEQVDGGRKRTSDERPQRLLRRQEGQKPIKTDPNNNSGSVDGQRGEPSECSRAGGTAAHYQTNVDEQPDMTDGITTSSASSRTHRDRSKIDPITTTGSESRSTVTPSNKNATSPHSTPNPATFLVTPIIDDATLIASNKSPATLITESRTGLAANSVRTPPNDLEVPPGTNAPASESVTTHEALTETTPMNTTANTTTNTTANTNMTTITTTQTLDLPASILRNTPLSTPRPNIPIEVDSSSHESPSISSLATTRSIGIPANQADEVPSLASFPGSPTRSMMTTTSSGPAIPSSYSHESHIPARLVGPPVKGSTIARGSSIESNST